MDQERTSVYHKFVDCKQLAVVTLGVQNYQHYAVERITAWCSPVNYGELKRILPTWKQVLSSNDDSKKK